MARLEIEIGGSDKGGNAELQETLGLLQELAALKKGLTVDLFKARTIDDIKRVGENLTGVNIRIGEYLGLASKATQAWKDDRTNSILAALSTKMDVAKTNVKAFGSTIRTNQAELKSYQSAFDQLIANGLDRTDTEVISLEGKIKSLTATIAQQKAAMAEQSVYANLSTKLKQIAGDVNLTADVTRRAKAEMAAYQAAYNALIKQGIDPADARLKEFAQTLRIMKSDLSNNTTNNLIDDRTAIALENLATKLAVIKTNVASFGATLATNQGQLRAYQAAFNELTTLGMDPASADMQALKANIDTLTAAVTKNKSELAQQGVYDALGTKLRQINNNVGLAGNSFNIAKESVRAYQTAIDNLIKAGVDPASAKIQSMKDAVAALQTQMAQDTARSLRDSFKDTGFIIQDAQNKVDRLKHLMNFATTEAQVARLNAKLSDAQKELKRLGEVGLTTNDIMHRFGASSNAAGVEFARIFQDAPYAFKSLGAMQDNFGAIGNNITRLTEIIPTYLAQTRAMIIAQGGVATSAAVMRASLRTAVTGWNGIILAISLAVSVYQVWSSLAAKRQRELEKEKDKVRTLAEQTDKYISTLDAENKLRIQAAANHTREIALLESLNATVMSGNSTKEQQRRAYEEMQRMFPAELSGLSMLEFQADKTGEAYKRLVENMRKAAFAKAANDLAGKAAEDQVKATMAIQAANEKLAKDRERLAKDEAEGIKQISQYGAAYANEVVRRQKALRGSIEQQEADLKMLGAAAGVASKEFKAYFDAAEKANGTIEQQTGIIDTLDKKIAALRLAKPYLKSEEAIAANVAETKKLQAELSRLEGKEIKAPKAPDIEKIISSVKTLGDAISGIYNPETDSGNLVGLKALEKANQATMNKYTDLKNKVNETEREKLEYYENLLKQRPKAEAKINEQIKQVTRDAANERKEIEQGLVRETEANKLKYAEDSAAKIAELDAKAGKTRIASRERDLADNTAYWDKVALSAEQYGITEAQLTEWRRSSVAQINRSWDAKEMESLISYQRRGNETVTQILLRQLNKRTQLKVRQARGDAEAIESIMRNHQAELTRIQEREIIMDMATDFDGSLFTVESAKIKAEMANLRNSSASTREEFVQLFETMSNLKLQADTLNVLKQGFDNLAGGISNNLMDALFEGENLMESLGETAKNVIKGLIGELIKLGIRFAINQALGTASMAASTAASIAAGKATAAAWATAAAFSSAATFGASAAAGGVALAALVASSKAMAGFKTGGYTGNVGRNRVAGVVHGQEFVVNASATKDYFPILKAMNSGRDITGLIPEKPKVGNMGSVREANPVQEIQVTGNIRNNVLTLSNDRGRRFNRKFGRG